MAQAAEKYTIVYRDDLSIHQQLAENLKDAIKEFNPTDVVSSFPLSKSWSTDTQAELLEQKSTKFVAVGDVALSFCMETAPEIPGIFLMLTSKQLVNRAESSGKWKGAKVWVEPQIQFKTIRQLLPDIETIGIVVTLQCRACKENFNIAANQYGMELKIVQTEERQQIIPAMREVYQQSDAFLLLPDPSLLNDIIVQELLRLQREYHRPLIGPASPFVRMGAMASINYKLDNLTQYIAKNISNTELMNNREKISECCLEVSINEKVAEQLDIRVKTETLKNQVNLISPPEGR